MNRPCSGSESGADGRSPGLEEYIEALSFLHYLEHRTLIPLAEVQAGLSDTETGEPVRDLLQACSILLISACLCHPRRLHPRNVRFDGRIDAICYQR